MLSINVIKIYMNWYFVFLLASLFSPNKVVKTESNCNTHSQMFYQYDSYPVTQKLYFLDLNFSTDFESKKNKI